MGNQQFGTLTCCKKLQQHTKEDDVMTRSLNIENTIINDDSDCYVIAEIGHNHQGSLEKAKNLIKAAHECGANAVKLQKRDNKNLFTKVMYNKPYDNPNSYGATYGEHREFLEFGKAEYLELQAYSKELGITFFATPFDFNSADFLEELDMPIYKIASGDLKSIPLIKHVASFGKPIIVSTGGGSMEDVQRVYDAVMPINPQLCIMQCTASYPCEFELLNLRVIETFRKAFPDIVVGLSSHDNGIAMGPVAYMLGARMIEKHFTLNRAWKGTDHGFSLEDSGLSRLVRDLQRTRVALGDGIKHTYETEIAPIKKMGKKLVANKDLPAGHVLSAEDIALKSPGDGTAPYRLEEFIGKQLGTALLEDDDVTDAVVTEAAVVA